MKKILSLLIFLILLGTNISIKPEAIYANESPQKRNISLYNNKKLITDKLTIIFNSQGKIFIPIAGIAGHLAIPIYSFPALGIAKGYIGEKETTFLLNTDAGYAYLKDKEIAVPEETVIVKSDDIYIDLNTLMQLLPLKIEYNAKKARIIVTGLIKPALTAGNEHESAKAVTQTEDKTIEKVSNSSELFGGISTDYDIGLTRKFENHTEVLASQVHLLTNAQVLKGDLFFALNGDKSGYKISNWNIKWKNDDARIFNEISAGYIKNHNLPFMPEIGQTGILLSNYANEEETNSFNVQDFEGDLLPGWEVQLYRNGEYVGNIKTDKNGRYKFSGVALQYGINEFDLKFYGPQGEKRTVHKVIDATKKILKPNQVRYRVGATFVHPEKDFSENQVSLSAEKGLSDDFSIFAEVSKVNRAFISSVYPGLDGLYINVGTNKRIENFLTRNMLIQNSLPEQKTHLGWVFATENYYGFSSGSIALKGAFAKDFIYPNEEAVPGKFLSNQVEAQVFKHINDDFSGTASVKKTTYLDKDEVLAQNIDLYSSYFQIPMHLNYNFQEELAAGNKTKTNKLGLSIAKSLDNFRINTDINYDLDRSKFLRSTTKLSENYKGVYFEQGISEDKQEDSKWLWSSIAKSFSGLNLSLQYRNDIFPKKSHSVTTSISSVGNLRYSSDAKTSWNTEQSFLQGVISGSVFADLNDNGIRDIAEHGIGNVGIVIDNILYEKTTDNNGHFLIGNMNPHEQHILTVREESLGDGLVIPAEGYQFSVQPGLVTKLNIPAVKGSEIIGNIYLSKDSVISPVENIGIFLLDSKGNYVKATKSQRDGRYKISGVRPGRYSLAFDQNVLKKLGYEPLQGNLEFEIAEPAHKENTNFYLLPTALSTINESIENAADDNTIEQLPIKSVNRK